jgi:sugar lactone lactonase YvrE
MRSRKLDVLGHRVMSAGYSRIGDFSLVWGESLRWDDSRERLYFVDCAEQTLHWLESQQSDLHTMKMPGLPTGVVLTEGPELVVCLDDGLRLVDPEAQSTELLAAYPDGMHGRANDAAADGHGNIVTGTLNRAPGPGAYWWYSVNEGWRLLDDGIGNANGPVVLNMAGEETLVFADTLASKVYAYPYQAELGEVGERRVLFDHAELGGLPDGATADSDGGVWSCVLQAGKLARLTAHGLDRVIELPAPNPSDITFGGPAGDRLFVTSIAVDLGAGPPPEEASWLISIAASGVSGAPEARFSLS